MFETKSNAYTDEDVQRGFDAFFATICSWRKRYNTKNLKNFWMFGVGYDGYQPGNNPSFLGLYRELMNLVADKVIDKPIGYYGERDGVEVEILEHEDGTEEIVPVKK
jgi:hypothetical protein